MVISCICKLDVLKYVSFSDCCDIKVVPKEYKNLQMLMSPMCIKGKSGCFRSICNTFTCLELLRQK